jgi:Rps23 Pro-64 3,4-dihydroxylase Tpa1-like proline 4-hydroxylase
MDWVIGKYINAKLAKEFKSHRPFPHLFLNDFFTQKVKLVRTALLNESFVRKDKDLFSFSQTNDLSRSTIPVLREFYSFFSSEKFLNFVSSIVSSKLCSVDMSGFVYSDGDYLLPHDDRFEGRKIAYVVNLSEGFSEKDGGQLSFFSYKRGPFKIVKSFVPVFNSFVLFEVSKKSFHQVNEVLSDKKRLTLAGWFYE